MKISTKARYGMKAVVELALHYGEGPISLKDIAIKYDMSFSYLEQLIAILKKAGYVKSIRGKMGGYELVTSPDKIMVGDVLRALEKDLSITDCGSSLLDNSLTCDHENICVTKMVWFKLQKAIDETLDGLSISDLLEIDLEKGNINV